MDVLSEIAVREIDDVMLGVHLWTAEYLNHITGIIMYGGFASSSADLRTLGVDENTYVVRHLAHVVYNGPHSLS